jgi:hypothetical protein
MIHQHTSQVNKWGFNDKDDFVPVEYICKECGDTYPESPIYDEPVSDHINHIDYTDGCFTCKLLTIQLGTGDAGRAESMSQRKWDAELSAYRDARSQGIQPSGTTMKKINEAKAASDKLGVAYNAESMPAAEKITKQGAQVMKETGVM